MHYNPSPIEVRNKNDCEILANLTGGRVAWKNLIINFDNVAVSYISLLQVRKVFCTIDHFTLFVFPCSTLNKILIGKRVVRQITNFFHNLMINIKIMKKKACKILVKFFVLLFRTLDPKSGKKFQKAKTFQSPSCPLLLPLKDLSNPSVDGFYLLSKSSVYAGCKIVSVRARL